MCAKQGTVAPAEACTSCLGIDFWQNRRAEKECRPSWVRAHPEPGTGPIVDGAHQQLVLCPLLDGPGGKRVNLALCHRESVCVGGRQSQGRSKNDALKPEEPGGIERGNKFGQRYLAFDMNPETIQVRGIVAGVRWRLVARQEPVPGWCRGLDPQQ